MDALGVVGVELLLDRRQRGGGAGDGDALLALAIAVPASSRDDQAADVVGERLELVRRGRVVVR